MLDLSLVRVEQVSEFWRNAILGGLILVAVVGDVAVGDASAPLVREAARPSAETATEPRRHRPAREGGGRC